MAEAQAAPAEDCAEIAKAKEACLAEGGVGTQLLPGFLLILLQFLLPSGFPSNNFSHLLILSYSFPLPVPIHPLLPLPCPELFSWLSFLFLSDPLLTSCPGLLRTVGWLPEVHGGRAGGGRRLAHRPLDQPPVEPVQIFILLFIRRRICYTCSYANKLIVLIFAFLNVH